MLGRRGPNETVIKRSGRQVGKENRFGVKSSRLRLPRTGEGIRRIGYEACAMGWRLGTGVAARQGENVRRCSRVGMPAVLLGLREAVTEPRELDRIGLDGIASW
jgi:hypothetical protein